MDSAPSLNRSYSEMQRRMEANDLEVRALCRLCPLLQLPIHCHPPSHHLILFDRTALSHLVVSQLIAANAETDRLRGQLRQVARTATARVKSLQDELQSELFGLQDDLGVASLQMSILCEELSREEEKRRASLEIEHLQAAIRIRVRQSRRCRKALCEWLRLTRERRIAGQWLPESRAMRGAFCSWKELRRWRRATWTAIAGMRYHGIRRALTAWIDAACRQSTQFLVVARSIASLRHQEARRALNEWVHSARRADSIRRKLLSSFIEWQGSGMRRAWSSWTSLLTARQKLLASVRSFLLTGCKRALNSWRALNRRRGVRLRFLRGCLSSMSSVAKRRALNSWVALARRGAIAARALAAWRERGVWRAMGAWTETVRVRSELRFVLGRAIASLWHQGMRRALNSWTDRAVTMSRVRQMLLSAVAEWRGSGVRCAWWSWSAAIATHNTILAACCCILQRGARRAFNSWRADTALAAARRHHRTPLGKPRRMLGCVSKLAAEGRALRKALNSWLTTSRVRTLMHNAAAGRTLLGERRALTSWALSVNVRSGLRFIVDRTKASLKLKGLRRALNMWIERAASGKTVQRMLLSALPKTKWRVIGLGSALRSWRDAAAKRGQRQRWLCGCQLSMACGNMRRALNSWVALSRKQEFAARALAAWRERSVGRAMGAWVEAVRAHSELRFVLGRTVSSLRHQGLRRALIAWSWSRKARLRRRRKLHSTLRAFRASTRVSGMYHAWLSWVAVAKERYSLARPEHDRRIRLVRRAMGIWLRIHISAVAADFAHGVFQQRTKSLSETIAAQQLELAELHHELKEAREAAQYAVAHASNAIEKSDERVLQNKRSHELQWQQLQIEMQGQVGDALEEQRLNFVAVKDRELAEAKREWLRESTEFDRNRDMHMHSMQLRLSAAQTHACQMLLDKEQQRQMLVRERFASPTKALHSLTARGRAQPRPDPRPRAGRHPASPFAFGATHLAGERRAGRP